MMKNKTKMTQLFMGPGGQSNVDHRLLQDDKNPRRGFTLIELLVVIAIIGILSSVVLASLSTARAKSRDARRIADIDQLRTALEMYFDSNSTYPTTTAVAAQKWDLNASYTNDATNGGIKVVATAGNIAKVPTPPGSGAYYYYCAGSSTPTSSTANCTSGAVAAGYMLGADLERSDNAALKTDADITFTTAANFSGADGTSCSAGAGVYCFDISN